MDDERQINPRHGEVRGVLRIAGPLVLAIGLMLIIVGFGSLLSSMGTFQPPRYFWCAFVGMPVVFLGIVMTAPAYMGMVSRYMSAEVAPVQKDTFNYLAEGTSPGVRTMAEAAGQGFATGAAGANQAVMCPGCQKPNRASAQFCEQCGAPLGARVCPRCAVRNDANARFCNQCGAQLA